MLDTRPIYHLIRNECFSDLKLHSADARLKQLAVDAAEIKVGVYLETDSIFIENSHIEFKLRPPGHSEGFLTYGVVRWFDDGSNLGQSMGMGVDILEIVRKPAETPATAPLPHVSPASASDNSSATKVQSPVIAKPGTAKPVAASSNTMKPDAEKSGAKKTAVVKASVSESSLAKAIAPILSGVNPFFPAPDTAAVAKCLSELIGKEVTVNVGGPTSLKGQNGSDLVSVYAFSDSQKLGAIVVWDLRLACYTGAALTMISPDIAKESVKSGQIADNLLENFQELANICCSLFNVSASAHVKLAKVYAPPSPLPDDVRALMASPAARLDFEVGIPDCPTGKMALLIAG